jgi:hypothetical protein
MPLVRRKRHDKKCQMHWQCYERGALKLDGFESFLMEAKAILPSVYCIQFGNDIKWTVSSVNSAVLQREDGSFDENRKDWHDCSQVETIPYLLLLRPRSGRCQGDDWRYSTSRFDVYCIQEYGLDPMKLVQSLHSVGSVGVSYPNH